MKVFSFVVAVSADKLGYDLKPTPEKPVLNVNAFKVYGPPPATFTSFAQVSTKPTTIKEYNKEFYTFTAPEEEFRETQNVQEAVNHLRNNLRVVFIKNPENNAFENAALSLVNSAVNQKTAIYVLNKQPDISGLASKLTTVHTTNNAKPEVYFVKYRTPEDALNAQQTIQSQYDSYAGHTNSYNNGVASVLNFASKAPSSVQTSSGLIDLPLAAVPPLPPSKVYLPPVQRGYY